MFVKKEKRKKYFFDYRKRQKRDKTKIKHNQKNQDVGKKLY